MVAGERDLGFVELGKTGGGTPRCRLGVLVLATFAQLHTNTLTIASGSGVTALQDTWVYGTFNLVENFPPAPTCLPILTNFRHVGPKCAGR